MRVPGKKLVQQSFRRARSRLLGGVPVLGYHRVGEAQDPFGLNVSASHFAAHLDVLTRRTLPMRLSDALSAAARRTVPRNAVVVTFDDGYKDTLDTVAPALERAGVPATIFVSTGYMGREFWWDELTRLVMDTACLPDDSLEIRGRKYSWRASSNGSARRAGAAAARRGFLMSVADDLRLLRPSARDDAMRAVRTWVGQQASDTRDSPRGLTDGELRHLAGHPSVEIGAHTVSHPVLSTLPPSEQHREVLESREVLQAITGRPVTSFSYPHGAYTSETLAIVREAGFAVACCSTPDVLMARTDPLAVPRLWVGDQDGDSFDRWLNSWLGS